MDEQSNLPQRKAPAHFSGISPGNRATIYFITVCTKDRKPVLNSDAAHAVLLEAWREADNYLVGRYVIMPDHVHFFCGPAVADAPVLSHWMRFWKSLAARKWPSPPEKELWQREYWDTQLRASDSYSAKWMYVQDNPVRAGLVKRSEDWPYQGEMNALFWHD